MEFNDLLVIRRKSPKYLSTILNHTEDIVLVFKADGSLDDELDISVSPVKTSNTSCLDITGSPLKVNLDNTSLLNISTTEICSNFWTKDEEKYGPLPYEKASAFIIDYCRKNSKNTETIWCICDGSDEKNTVFLSALKTPELITRNLVTIEGYFPKNDPKIMFDNLCSHHQNRVTELTSERQLIPLNKLKSNISCVYEIVGTKFQTKIDSNNSNTKGNVTLEVSWNVCSAEIPIDNSKCTMVVRTVIGQESSPLFLFWKELILLELYIKTLSEYGAGTLGNNDWLPSNIDITENIDVIDSLIDIINTCQRQSRFETTTDLIKNISSVQNRHTYDITDHLWTLLTRCSTYGALSDCLNIVFTEIANTEADIYISETNTTMMAQIIRGVLAGKIAVPRLTDLQPIEMLIDIGLEKLRKDFIHIYTNTNITDIHELNELFHDLMGNDAAAPKLTEMSRKTMRATLCHRGPMIRRDRIESRMKILGQLHTILEILILVPADWIQYSKKSIFDFYTKDEMRIDSFAAFANNKSHKIKVDLPISEIYQNIETNNPIMWRFSVTSARPAWSITSVFHLSQIPIFPPAIYNFDPDVPDETIVESAEIYYHYTLLTKVTNFIKTTLR